jgi:hypothetical protein
MRMTAHCASCGTEVPTGAFCASCGGDLSADHEGGPVRLRLGAYAAASSERVLRLWVVSSLFPHLPRRSRAPFGVGLAVLLMLLAGFTLQRWQAPMIAIAAVGFPLLFVAYLREIDVRRDVSIRSLILTAVTGAVLGVGWAYIAGTMFADGYDVALGFEENAGPTVLSGVALSVVEVLLMLVPALVVRILSRSTRESLDGFLVGAFGATAFTAAATCTLLAPQLATGLVADDRSLDGLVVEAGIQGVAMPLASAAVGGMFGVAVWFSRRADASHRHLRPAFTAVVVAVVLFVGFGLLDISPFPNSVYVGGYLLIAALALLALRIAIQAALLHEVHDGTTQDEQLRCADCDHVIPHMTFCPNCGVAIHASSRASRIERMVEPAPSYTRTLGTTGAGIAIAAAIAVVVSILITPGVAPYRCPPDCGRPPIGTPVETNPRFTAENGAFTVSYPGKGSAYKAKFNPNGVVLDYVAGDTGTLALFGEPARDRAAKEITLDLIKEKYPNATVDYEIPNVSVGYQPGYGVAADEYPQNSIGRFTRLRMLVMVAVKHDYALIAAAVGPYRQFSPDLGPGHPSGANLELAMDIGKYVNSFSWHGDRYGPGL